MTKTATPTLVVANPPGETIVDHRAETKRRLEQTKPPEPKTDTSTAVDAMCAAMGYPSSPFPTSANPPATATSPVTPTLEVPTEVDKTLAKILGWKRSHLSEAEMGFRKWLREEIKARGYDVIDEEQGNILVQVRLPKKEGDKEGAVAHQLFSCHIDTMHDCTKKGEPWLQKIEYDANFGHIFLASEDKKQGNCLGADDGAGVWIMLEMISAGVPGNYLFHVGEERGFIGANAMYWNRKDWLSSFKHAIAFDRPVAHDVVTTQGGQRCCSDAFSDALAKALNDASPGLTMAGRKAGGVTDTSKYTSLISECTNVGVGYWQQHGPNETLDYGHLVRLRDACIRVDWTTLPVERDPKAYDFTEPKHQGWQGQRGRGTYHDGYRPPRQGQLGFTKDESDELDAYWRSKGAQSPSKPKKKARANVTPTVTEPTFDQEMSDMSFEDVVIFCEELPREAAAQMISQAAEIEALRAKVKFYQGVLK
jgi:hypothetical protein